MVSDMQTVSASLRQALLDDFKRFYHEADVGSLDKLDRLYTEDVEFRDPVHTLHGRLALRRYLRELYRDCNSIRFDYLDEHITENGASIQWEMKFSHPRVSRGQPITVRGMTLVRFTDRIYYQEDCYDMGQMLYQHIPVLGAVVRYINRRLAG